jgi:hypothetical protein
MKKESMDGLFAAQDSFVRGAIDAASQRLHLVFRPEDAWFTILTQLSFYLRKHWDEKMVRDKFDNLQGNTSIPYYDLWLFNLRDLMEAEFKIRNKTGWMLDWVQPRFSTRLRHGLIPNPDRMMASTIMMASSTPTFEQIAPLSCTAGIPSITLLGVQNDWEQLLNKLTRMSEFGAEPAQYGEDLRPILSRFVTTFQDSSNPDIRRFWNTIVTAKRAPCNTTRLVTGWINGFHHWNATGHLLDQTTLNKEDALSRVTLDGISYPWRHTDNLPIASSIFPMCMVYDNMQTVKGGVMVGMIGKTIRKGIPEGYAMAMQKANVTLPSTVAHSDHSILRPVPAWYTYVIAKVNFHHHCLHLRIIPLT